MIAGGPPCRPDKDRPDARATRNFPRASAPGLGDMTACCEGDQFFDRYLSTFAGVTSSNGIQTFAGTFSPRAIFTAASMPPPP